MEPASARHGSLLFLRLIEVADTIDLTRAAEKLGEARRVRLRRPVSETLVTAALPLEIDLGPYRLPAALGEAQASARARVYAFGVVSVVVETALAPGTPLAELATPVFVASELAELDDHARLVAKDLVSRFGDALTRPVETGVVEGYSMVVLREVDGDPLRDRDALARILLAEPKGKPLAAALCDEVLAHPHRWFADDLVVLHYEAALVVEPGATEDLATILELALTQLLEFRAYDAEIDRELDRVYAHLARAGHRGWWLFGTSTFASARDTMQRLVELAELADSADNATKFASDLYLANLYLDALERFRVADWRGSVQRKLALFTRAYELLKDESDVRRSALLELTMVLLVLIEVVVFVVGWRA
jgi:hypothetical protein